MCRLQKAWLVLLVLGATFSWLNPAVGADKTPDPTGTWKWERTRGDNTRQFTLRIKRDGDNVTGTYTMRRNETENETKIENTKLEGDQLSFRVVRQFNDREFTINFQGKVSEDAIKGKGEFSTDGGSREFDWEAKRSVDLADVVGTWKFRIETPNGDVREPSLKLAKKGEELTGVYKGRRGDIEAKNIEIKDNQLTFEISGENDGNQWQVTYKGKPRGDTIEGTIDFDFGGNTGTVDFEGKLEDDEDGDDEDGDDEDGDDEDGDDEDDDDEDGDDEDDDDEDDDDEDDDDEDDDDEDDEDDDDDEKGQNNG